MSVTSNKPWIAYPERHPAELLRQIGKSNRDVRDQSRRLSAGADELDACIRRAGKHIQSDLQHEELVVRPETVARRIVGTDRPRAQRDGFGAVICEIEM